MRHAIHRVKFYVDSQTRTPEGAWDQARTSVPAADLGDGWDVQPDGSVQAGVGEPTIEDGEVVDPTRVEARVRHHIPVSSHWWVEVLDHPVHSGMYRIISISGGRRIKLIGLQRWHRQDGTDATQ